MQTRTSTDTYGVDLSAYQGNIDWNKMKAQNVKFAILRCYGTDHSAGGDVNFTRYVSEARANGIPTGGYYFATPTPPLDLNQARTQAQQFIDKLQTGYGTGNYGDLIPFVDIEHNPNAPVGKDITDLGKANLVTWIQEFRNYFQERTNRVLGIYCGEWFMKDPTNMGYTDAELQPLASMPLWVAEYERYWSATRIANSPAPNNFGGWSAYVCWQFSDRGAGATYGVSSQYIDLDVTKNLDELRSRVVNQVTETPTEPAPTPVEPAPVEPIPTEPAPTEPVVEEPKKKEDVIREIMVDENIMEVWEHYNLTTENGIIETTIIYRNPNVTP